MKNTEELDDISIKILCLNADYNLRMILTNLKQLGYINAIGHLTDKGKQVVQKVNSSAFRYTEEEMSELVETIRSIYPPGLKPGTNKNWRGTPAEVSKKLYDLMKQYTDITKEEVIESVKRNMNTGESKYRQALPYFICKFNDSKMYEMICAMRDEKTAGIDITDLMENDEDNEDQDWGIPL